MDKNLVDNLVNSLNPYLSKLEENLDFITKPFESLEIESLAPFKFTYTEQKGRGIKFIDFLRSFFNDENINDKDYIVKFWIINKWGGISSFKDNKEKLVNSNRTKIDNFLTCINERKMLNKSLFEVISSLSKVASFSNSTKYFVYDSRVIYCLNWLILKSNSTGDRFFPIPQGRNAKLSFFDLDTIIRLSKKKEYKEMQINSLYYSHKDAYYIYCDLIEELSRRILQEKPAYYLEMFLFSLVDNIYEEIREYVEVEIKV